MNIYINDDEWVSDFLLTNRTSRRSIYMYAVVFRSVKKRNRGKKTPRKGFFDLCSAEQKAIEHDFRVPRWGVCRHRCGGRTACTCASGLAPYCIRRVPYRYTYRCRGSISFIMQYYCKCASVIL